MVILATVLPARADVPAPIDQEVCFSPEEPCDQKLLKFVDGAKTSLDVAIYDINLGHFVDKLIQKAHQIPVRILVDRRQSKGQHSAVRRLIGGGVDVRFGHQRGIMHNKFVIVDGASLETGSFNYTQHAAAANNENQVYLASAPIVERYKKRFEHLWKQAAPPKRKFTP
jgi:phosphatidylserine/phosphatidylglycerophosphate/cardiolipin synthase-like enzyme